MVAYFNHLSPILSLHKYQFSVNICLIWNHRSTNKTKSHIQIFKNISFLRYYKNLLLLFSDQKILNKGSENSNRIWKKKEIVMARVGFGPWFHKKIVDPLQQILRRFSLSLSLCSKEDFFLWFNLFLCVEWFIECNSIEIWSDFNGFVLNCSLL